VWRRMKTVTLGLGLALMCSAGPAAQAPVEDEELANGIRQAQEGDFDEAVVTLDGVVRRLAAQPGRAKELARAYTYLAIAYYGLSQEQMAKARFLEAWRADPEMELSSREFPPRILRFLKEAAEEARKAGPATPPAGAAPAPAPGAGSGTTAAASGAPPKKGGSKTLPILLGVGAAAGVGVAVAAGGGGGGSPPPAATPPPVPTASVSSAAAGQNINCTTPVTATVIVNNPTASALGITGIRLNTAAPSGGCAATTFTYATLLASVAAGQTATVFNGSLYIGGAGCCTGTCSGGSCNIQQTFTVLTTSGDLAAGAFNYVVPFVGCAQCMAAGSLSATACPPASASLR